MALPEAPGTRPDPHPGLQHHLKKLEGRRLDFDYKKKRQGKIPDEGWISYLATQDSQSLRRQSLASVQGQAQNWHSTGSAVQSWSKKSQVDPL